MSTYYFLGCNCQEEEELLTVNSIFGSAKVTQESDNIVILQLITSRDGVKSKYPQVFFLIL